MATPIEYVHEMQRMFPFRSVPSTCIGISSSQLVGGVRDRRWTIRNTYTRRQRDVATFSMYVVCIWRNAGEPARQLAQRRRRRRRRGTCNELASLASQPATAQAGAGLGASICIGHCQPIPSHTQEPGRKETTKKQNARAFISSLLDRSGRASSVYGDRRPRAPSTQRSRSRTHTLDRDSYQLWVILSFDPASAASLASSICLVLTIELDGQLVWYHEIFLLPQGPARKRHRFTVSFTCKFITISIMFVRYDGTLIVFDGIVVQRIHEGSVAGSGMNPPYKK